MTGNEYFFLPAGGSSISVPPASVSEIRGPIRANATGVRSWISTLSRLGTKRITLADSTHGICSSCVFCCDSGMKKMLRPISAPITSMICALVTFCIPVTSMLSLDSTQERRFLVYIQVDQTRVVQFLARSLGAGWVQLLLQDGRTLPRHQFRSVVVGEPRA